MSRALPTLASRYTITREIASGGMATVYLGRLAGPGGFSRPVAIKRPHPHVARHPDFRAMLLDEGRLAASISHPNVVSTLDVVAEGDDLFLVMEYVPGETMAQIQRLLSSRREIIPPSIACAILHGVLEGLGAVHSARDERGEPLDIVHRDVSPQNILVGRDGVARILDFGVAKAARRLQVTRDGQLKGKIAYMAPEQMQGTATERTDVYAASIVLWEALAGKRLFTGEDEVAVFSKALSATVEPPSKHALAAGAKAMLEGHGDAVVWRELDGVVLRGLARDPGDRFSSAKEMATALERCVERATAPEVGAWLERTTSERLPPNEMSVEPSAAPGRDGASSVVTIRDAGERGMHDPLATLTGPAREELALQVAPQAPPAESSRPIPAPAPDRTRTPRRRPAVLALGGAIAASLIALAIAGHRGTPRTEPSSAQPTAASPAATTTAMTAQTSADTVATEPVAPPAAGASSQPSSGGASDGPETTNAASRGRAKPAPKNRVERTRRVPVVSQAIDVSHAIDERH